MNRYKFTVVQAAKRIKMMDILRLQNEYALSVRRINMLEPNHPVPSIRAPELPPADPVQGQLVIEQLYRAYNIQPAGKPTKLGAIFAHFSEPKYDWTKFDENVSLKYECFDQWKLDESYTNEFEKPCACSQRNVWSSNRQKSSIRDNFYVINMVNGNVLRVGSRCVINYVPGTKLASELHEAQRQVINARKAGKVLISCLNCRQRFRANSADEKICSNCIKVKEREEQAKIMKIQQEEQERRWAEEKKKREEEEKVLEEQRRAYELKRLEEERAARERQLAREKAEEEARWMIINCYMCGISIKMLKEKPSYPMCVKCWTEYSKRLQEEAENRWNALDSRLRQQSIARANELSYTS